MKNVRNNVWNLIKKFPLSLFCIFVLLAGLFIKSSGATYDSQGLGGGLVLLIILLHPIFLLIGNFAKLLGFDWLINFFNTPLFGICIFSFFIDLFLLYIRKCLIPTILHKNKNLLIPNFLKILFKSHNGKS